MFDQIATHTTSAFADVWQGIVNFLPSLIAAIIIFIIGWFVAIGIGKLVAEILKKLKFNNIFKHAGWQGALKKADMEVDPSHFIGAIIKWIFVIIFLMICSDIVGWTSFSLLLEKIILWIPNLIVAIIILVVAIVVADILDKIVQATVEKIGVASAAFLGALTKWVIYAVAILAILSQLHIAPVVVNSIIIGIIAMLALAFGLAFGIGGREEAARVLTKFRKQLEDRD